MEQFIEILYVIPYGVEIMAMVGTLTGLMTVVAPFVNFVIHATETKADDEFLKRVKANPVAKKLWQVGKLLKRFSLVR